MISTQPSVQLDNSNIDSFVSKLCLANSKLHHKEVVFVF